MRIGILYIFLLAFIAQLTSNFFYFIHFKVEQQRIEETFCENRFNSIEVCHGQCYFIKTIKKHNPVEKAELIYNKCPLCVLKDYTVETTSNFTTEKLPQYPPIHLLHAQAMETVPLKPPIDGL